MSRGSLYLLFWAAPIALCATSWVHAAGRTPPEQSRATSTGSKREAPIDLTGYWVAVVTEDWRYRMVTPGKGEYAGIPINLDAKKVADSWDPVADERAGEQCKSYGVGGVMRVPGRLHITWADADTLKVELDAGKQTRLLHFNPESVRGSGAGNQEHSWQGRSVASWDNGSLKVTTDRMRAGYLRKNGVPYSEKSQLTEYWNLYKEKNGDQWLVITSILEDPTFLQEPYISSPNFKKEPNGSKWEPMACSAQW